MRDFVEDDKRGDDPDSALLKSAGIHGCVPDLAVYKKDNLMRLPWQTKKGERPLIPDDSRDILEGVASCERDVPVVPWDPPCTPPERFQRVSVGAPDTNMAAKVRQHHVEIEEALNVPTGFLEGVQVKQIKMEWILCPPCGALQCPCKGSSTTSPHNAFVLCSLNRCQVSVMVLCAEKSGDHVEHLEY